MGGEPGRVLRPDGQVPVAESTVTVMVFWLAQFFFFFFFFWEVTILDGRFSW